MHAIEIPKKTLQHIQKLASLPHVSKVLAPKTDVIKTSQPEGVYFDAKGLTPSYAAVNQIPLVIIDNAGNGRCYVTVCAQPGNIDSVRTSIDQYILDGCGTGRVTKNEKILAHLENIASLYEVQRLLPGAIVRTTPYASGVYDIIRSNGDVRCTVIGNISTRGLSAIARARPGLSGDLEYILQNYRAYFEKV